MSVLQCEQPTGTIPPVWPWLKLAEVEAATVRIVDSGDGVLVARVAAGDEEAIGEIFDRYAAFLFGLAWRVTGDRSAAEDVVQEVITTLWSHPDRYDSARGSLRAFLGVQVHRRAVDAVRREVRRTAHEKKLQAMTNERQQAADTTDAIGMMDLVRQAIHRLPEAQRQAVELAYYKGFTQSEVANALGIPEGTAKSRLRLAQAKLFDWLSPQFVEIA